jgi:hypothetical protein
LDCFVKGVSARKPRTIPQLQCLGICNIVFLLLSTLYTWDTEYRIPARGQANPYKTGKRSEADKNQTEHCGVNDEQLNVNNIIPKADDHVGLL